MTEDYQNQLDGSQISSLCLSNGFTRKRKIENNSAVSVEVFACDGLNLTYFNMIRNTSNEKVKNVFSSGRSCVHLL